MADGFQIGSAFVDITARDSVRPGLASATRDIDRSTRAAGAQGGENIGRGFKSRMAPHVAAIGASIGGLFVADKAASFLSDSISGWRDHQAVLKQTDAVIKSTGGSAGVTTKQVDDLAGAIEAKTGVDGDQITSGENMLLTFTNIKNQVGAGNDVFNQATQTITDMAAATGGSMKGSAIQLGKALNDPIKGVGALSKVGVTFTDQQKAQIKAMQDAGNTAGAQKVILAELSKEFGGSAASQMTDSKRMEVAFHGLQDTVGQLLLPVVTTLANVISTKLLPALTVGAAWVQTHVVPALKSMGQWISKNSAWLVPLVGVVLSVAAAVKAWTIAQALLNTVMEANPIIMVTLLVAGLVIGVVAAYEHFKTFRTIVNAAFAVIKVAAKVTWAALKGVFDSMKVALHVLAPVFKVVFAGIKLYIHTTILAIKVYLKAGEVAFQSIATVARWLWHNVIVPVFDGIKNKISSAVSSIKSILGGMKNAVSSIGNAFSGAYSTVKRYLGHVVDAVAALPGKVRDRAGAMLSAGQHLISSLWSGLTSNVGGAASSIGDAVRSAVNSALNLPQTIGGWSFGAFGHNITLPSYTIGAFANGTDFAPGGMALVGERGPELVNLPRGSQVLTNRETKNLMNSGSSVVIHNMHISVNAKELSDATKAMHFLQQAATLAGNGGFRQEAI